MSAVDAERIAILEAEWIGHRIAESEAQNPKEPNA
jgi:hypothetical protein